MWQLEYHILERTGLIKRPHQMPRPFLEFLNPTATPASSVHRPTNVSLDLLPKPRIIHHNISPSPFSKNWWQQVKPGAPLQLHAKLCLQPPHKRMLQAAVEIPSKPSKH